MVRRVTTFLGEDIPQEKLVALRQYVLAQKLEPIIDVRFQGRGKWENIPTRRILMTLTRQRPRDLVKLFYYSAKEAHRLNADRIHSTHLQSIFVRYSNERLTDVINEFKAEVPNLRDVLLGMRQTRNEMDKGIGPIFDDGQLVTKLRSIMRSGQIYFSNGGRIDATSLARFLYRCDFVTARSDRDGKIVRLHFSDNQLLAEPKAQFGFKWEIHPAYRWALEPRHADRILDFDLV